MKKISALIISMVLIFYTNEILSQNQVKSFLVLSEIKNATSFDQFPLVDYIGFRLASYHPVLPEKETPGMELNFKEKKIVLNNPLSNICINPKADRIFTFGDHIDFHKQFDFNLQIFDANGNLIRSVNKAGHTPFRTAFAENGDVYVSLMVDQADKSSLVLKKFDKKGDLIWVKDLVGFSPLQLEVSPSGNFIVAVQGNEDFKQSFLSVYDSEGNLVNSINHYGLISNIIISSKDQMLVLSSGKWFFYNSLKDQTPQNEGALNGVPIQKYPVTFSSDNENFALLTTLDNQYIVQAIKTKTGTLMNESSFPGNPVWVFYRIIRFIDNSSLELTTDNKTIKLKINEE